MCILGGKGTVAGPVVGAILLIAFNEFFVSQFGGSEINLLGTGIIMLFALIFFPVEVTDNTLPPFETKLEDKVFVPA